MSTKFRKRCLLLFLLPSFLHAIDPNMQRVLNLAYGDQSGPSISPSVHTQQQMFNYIKQIQPNASAIDNFMLNVQPANIQLYQPLLGLLVNQSHIPIYPALGKPDLTQYQINDRYWKNIADEYRTFSDCIQLDGLQQYATDTTHFDINNLYDMIEYLNVTKGFKHIQLNPWPLTSGPNKQAFSFGNPAVDSAIEQVIVAYTNADHTQFDPNDPSDWTINLNKINSILDFNSTIRIIINYENKPGEAALATLSTNAQIAAFQKTLANITNSPGIRGRVHWTPPWSVNYDPVVEGTWNWIVTQLNNGNPP